MVWETASAANIEGIGNTVVSAGNISRTARYPTNAGCNRPRASAHQWLSTVGMVAAAAATIPARAPTHTGVVEGRHRAISRPVNRAAGTLLVSTRHLSNSMDATR